MSSDYHREMALRAVELLGDGEWHPYEQTLRAVMKLVPPGVALRRRDQDRIAEHEQRAKQREREGRPLDENKANGGARRSTEEQIYTGQRAIARDFLSNKRNFETDRRGSQKVGSGHDRKVRMIRRPSNVIVDQAPNVQMDDLFEENVRLRSRVKRQDEEISEYRAHIRALQNYLDKIGHREAAERIADGGVE